MYDFFIGTVAALDTSGRLSLNVQGVGYSLRVSEQTRARIPLDGKPVTLWARLVVRDDDLLLFGFADVAERAAFDLVTTVQGVGPAVAMALLSGLGVDELRRALAAKDLRTLSKAKGVGPKAAERLAVELHDKVDRIPAAAPIAGTSGQAVSEAAADEARRALVALGFGPAQAAEAVAKVGKPAMTPEQVLRAALSLLR